MVAVLENCRVIGKLKVYIIYVFVCSPWLQICGKRQKFGYLRVV